MTRRDVILSAVALAPSMRAAQPYSMGIATTSFGAAGYGGRRAGKGTLEFLEYCHSLGAGGIQAGINGDIPKVRARAEQLGMYIEAMASLPRGGDAASFEKSILDAKAAGALSVRVAALGGRRYETFATLDAWKKFVADTHAALKLAVPILEKHKVGMALENHKDWTLEDFLALLKTYSSEYVGVCVDFGNNVAMLDDPMEVVEKLAPYALSTHIKDMGVAPYDDGFLLSEVPLGEGMLDLKKIVSVVLAAKPKTKFSLEMMTRDPLQVPCLTEKYWMVFPGRDGKHLARTLRMVQKHAGKSLPKVSHLTPEERIKIEEANVKQCLRYGKENLNL